METRFEWREEYNIGVDIVEQGQQRLVRIFKKGFALIDVGKGKPLTLMGFLLLK